MVKKNKKHSLSTGSIIAIVLGVLVALFMILTFMDHQINSDEENTLSCNEGMTLGDDNLCHNKCGEGYCEGKDICYNEQCYTYPYTAVSCFGEFQESINEFNMGIAVVNKLPYDTCEEALFKYDRASSLFSMAQNASDNCISEIRNNAFLLEELGYTANTYLKEWDNATSEMAAILLTQKRLLDKDC